MERPRAGKHYPRSVGEFQAWFRTDADCHDYLDWLRWPAGFACPSCGHGERWSLGDRRIMCARCGSRTSVTAGTIFERTRTPLTVWFTASWLFATGKDGISALSLKRTLEFGSYQTAWAILHRLRSVLVRPGRDRLMGTVEVDETYIGGEEPGLRSGRARGKKVLTGIAVEVHDPKGLGRCRMGPLANASAGSLHAFVADHVEPGARVITDGWGGYLGLEQLGYLHDRRSQRAARARGEDPHELLPTVHRVASLVKRWLLGTHQGSVGDAHLPGYLNEFVFRFNRRRSRSRGLVFFRVLELAVAHAPVSYHDLIAHRRPRALPPSPPPTRGHPPEPGAPTRESALESWGSGRLRLNGYPQVGLYIFANADISINSRSERLRSGVEKMSASIEKGRQAVHPESSAIADVVKERYGRLASQVASPTRTSCCGSVEDASCGQRASVITADLYSAGQTDGLPEDAVRASLGCGNPTRLAELEVGQTVLDLGSGGGIDVLLAARHVGPQGFVYGLDMTDEMLTLARTNQHAAGVTNVEFLQGEIETIPLPNASVDVIISNCVINLSADKDRVLSEAYRVLRPGGRLAVSDVVRRRDVDPAVEQDMNLWTGCIAGALHETDYLERLQAAGFQNVAIEPTRILDAGVPTEGAECCGDPESDAVLSGAYMSAFIRGTKHA